MNKNFKLSLLLGTLLLQTPGYSESVKSISQTQIQIKRLNEQIQQLQTTLNSAHDKREVLHQELAGTEKQIGDGVQKMRTLQLDMQNKQQKINELENHVSELTQQLNNQQQQLAEHVRARYQMGEYQPLKRLLIQDNPHSVGRILTYYQYLVRSRQNLIEKIDATRKSLTENQDQLRDELVKKQLLERQLSHHQLKLEQHKNYHTAVLASLNTDIQSKQKALEEYQRNKNNLSLLLKRLAEQSITQSSKPFAQMRKKLPPPLEGQRRPLQKMNQGVTFFADEGSPVSAVYPGKVVFSDWLKGYGLLIIIDHGQGFMTLYAHNQSLFKRKGQSVKQHEQIASVGHTGGIRQNGLYFEVRHRGKAVSPLEWLS